MTTPAEHVVLITPQLTTTSANGAGTISMSLFIGLTSTQTKATVLTASLDEHPHREQNGTVTVIREPVPAHLTGPEADIYLAKSLAVHLDCIQDATSTILNGVRLWPLASTETISQIRHRHLIPHVYQDSFTIDDEPEEIDHSLRKYFERESFRWATDLHFPSHSAKNQFSSLVGSDQSVHVSSPPRGSINPTPKASYALNHPPRIGFLGRPVSYKGLGILIESIGLLDQDVELVCIGPTSPTRLDQVDTKSVITCTGWLPHLETQSLLTSLDILAVPSSNEFYGLAFDEGAALGLPLVALDLFAYRDRAIDGSNCLLVGPSQSSMTDPSPSSIDAAEYHKSLRDILNDETLRRQLGSSARNLWESTVPTPEEYISSLLEH